jgi:hypothetical protein
MHEGNNAASLRFSLQRFELSTFTLSVYLLFVAVQGQFMPGRYLPLLGVLHLFILENVQWSCEQQRSTHYISSTSYGVRSG